MLKVFVKTDKRESVLSSFVRSGLDFYSPERWEEGLVFEISVTSLHNLRRVARSIGVEWRAEPCGIVGVIWKKRRRFGILIGAVLGIFLIYLSTFFVWSVRIEGEGQVGQSEIIETLTRHGFYEGVLKRNVDVNEVAIAFLADRSEFSFCSINISGVVAHVELKERTPQRYAEPEDDPYNLISDSDGVVVRVEALNGTPMVKAGDTVHKGQIVVSGVVENTINTAFRLVRAEGRVWARVNTTLTFNVPLKYTEKKYTKEKNDTALRVLGHRIGFVRAPRTGDYDIVTNLEIPEVAGFELPFGVERILYAFYVEKEVTLTENEALLKAHDLYRKRALTEFEGAVVSNERFSHRIENDTLILECKIEAIQEICTREKIGVQNTES